MKRQVTLLILGLTMAFPLVAQQHWCGISHDDQEKNADRITFNRANYANQVFTRNGAVTYVAVRFILAADNDGADRANVQDAMDALCQMNDFYEDQEIQFYIKDLDMDLTNTIINGNSISNAGTNQVKAYLNSNGYYNALNVFLVRACDGTQGSGVLGFYTGNGDFVSIERGQVNSPLVVSHEVGHFFSLDHPFFGWEDNPYCEIGVNAPSVDPSGNQTELVNGSNCNSAGDRICDTPPDYLFGQCTFSCNYTGALDPLGVPIDVMEDNIMTYFFNCGPYLMTNGQKTAIAADLASGQRAYVRPNYTPNLSDITGVPTLLLPEDDEVLDAYNAVFFEWEAIAGADSYFLEIDRFSSFNTSGYQSYVIDGSTTAYITGTFDSDEGYHWRVTPFNEYYTCSSPSPSFEFTTGTMVAVQQVEAVEGFRAQPNPTTSNNNLILSIDASESFFGQLEILDITGKVTYQLGERNFITGNNQVQVPQGQLTPGVYFAKLTSGDKQNTIKIVVQ